MWIVLGAYAAVLVAGWLLQALNLRHLRVHGGEVPEELRGAIDAATLQRISVYTFEKTRLHWVKSALESVLAGVFLFSGFLGDYDRAITGEVEATLRGRDLVAQGLLFFLPLLVADLLLDMPFSLYGNFRIENRYGFNRMTPRLWLTDQLKTLFLSIVLGGIVIAAALGLVAWSPSAWWLAVWAFFLVFSLFLMYISPYVIEPLFFKFHPVRHPDLEAGIRDLMQRAGLTVSKVQQVDASRRSRHSNAYFTGIGKVKRIVLFDTLLEQMTPPEILAVLAHEIGHWKLRHILKRIILTEALALAALFVAARLLRWPGLPELVGLEGASFPARALILAFIASIVVFPFTPIASALSRRDEWQADEYACEQTGRPEDLDSALVKLARDNLANLHPHPLYAKFYYSHPPVVDRIRRLRERAARQERSA